MRILLVSFIFLSGSAVASLAGTKNTAVKVVEVPIKVVGAVVSSNDDDDDDEEELKNNITGRHEWTRTTDPHHVKVVL